MIPRRCGISPSRFWSGVWVVVSLHSLFRLKEMRTRGHRSRKLGGCICLLSLKCLGNLFLSRLTELDSVLSGDWCVTVLKVRLAALTFHDLAYGDVPARIAQAGEFFNIVLVL